jgi:hypothetical protein
VEQWLVERLPQIGAAASGLAALLAAAWKFKIGARLDRAGHWFWAEIRTTLWAKKDLVELKRQVAIREATFTTTEAENEKLLQRVNMLLDLCGGLDSDRRNALPPQTTTSRNDSPDSPDGTVMQRY